MFNEDLLKNVIATLLNVDAATIGPDFSMDTVESWDSLRHMNLVLALEEEFKVSISDDDVGNITSYPLIKLVLEELVQNK